MCTLVFVMLFVGIAVTISSIGFIVSEKKPELLIITAVGIMLLIGAYIVKPPDFNSSQAKEVGTRQGVAFHAMCRNLECCDLLCNDQSTKNATACSCVSIPEVPYRQACLLACLGKGPTVE